MLKDWKDVEGNLSAIREIMNGYKVCLLMIDEVEKMVSKVRNHQHL